jgi:hypothetical protein
VAAPGCCECHENRRFVPGEFAREILDTDDVKKMVVLFGFFVFDLWIFEGEGYFRRVQKYVLHRCHSFTIVGME